MDSGKRIFQPVPVPGDIALMSQSVSLNFRQSAYAQETGRVLIALVTITHDALAEPIRISTDPTQRIEEYTTDTDVVYGTISRGNTFLFLPVRIKLPDETEAGPGDITLEIDNIHRQYVETIRSISSPPAVTVELVMDNTPDTVEAQWPEFLLADITYDSVTISGTLRMETLMREPFPCGTFTPSGFPGVF